MPPGQSGGVRRARSVTGDGCAGRELLRLPPGRIAVLPGRIYRGWRGIHVELAGDPG
ncbi:MAG TPA: hypothetical protein VNG13_00040 [Mycobacteriales bacterium]|nr:hypothetical protein [Mycobacteriales bacterium]